MLQHKIELGVTVAVHGALTAVPLVLERRRLDNNIPTNRWFMQRDCYITGSIR